MQNQVPRGSQTGLRGVKSNLKTQWKEINTRVSGFRERGKNQKREINRAIKVMNDERKEINEDQSIVR